MTSLLNSRAFNPLTILLSIDRHTLTYWLDLTVLFRLHQFPTWNIRFLPIYFRELLKLFLVDTFLDYCNRVLSPINTLVCAVYKWKAWISKNGMKRTSESEANNNLRLQRWRDQGIPISQARLKDYQANWRGWHTSLSFIERELLRIVSYSTVTKLCLNLYYLNEDWKSPKCWLNMMSKCKYLFRSHRILHFERRYYVLSCLFFTNILSQREKLNHVNWKLCL